MKRIFKFPLAIIDIQSIDMPEGAEILSVQNQNGAVCAWALCDPIAPLVGCEIRIVGTGNPTPDNPGKFLGTVQTYDGSLVWHIFEVAK
jgi:hypothetical protein